MHKVIPQLQASSNHLKLLSLLGQNFDNLPLSFKNSYDNIQEFNNIVDVESSLKEYFNLFNNYPNFKTVDSRNKYKSVVDYLTFVNFDPCQNSDIATDKDSKSDEDSSSDDHDDAGRGDNKKEHLPQQHQKNNKNSHAPKPDEVQTSTNPKSSLQHKTNIDPQKLEKIFKHEIYKYTSNKNFDPRILTELQKKYLEKNLPIKFEIFGYCLEKACQLEQFIAVYDIFKIYPDSCLRIEKLAKSRLDSETFAEFLCKIKNL